MHARYSVILYRSQSDIDRSVTISVTFPPFTQFVLAPSVLIGHCPLSRGGRIWRRQRRGKVSILWGWRAWGWVFKALLCRTLTFPFYAGRGPSAKTRKRQLHLESSQAEQAIYDMIFLECQMNIKKGKYYSCNILGISCAYKKDAFHLMTQIDSNVVLPFLSTYWMSRKIKIFWLFLYLMCSICITFINGKKSYDDIKMTSERLKMIIKSDFFINHVSWFVVPLRNNNSFGH